MRKSMVSLPLILLFILGSSIPAQEELTAGKDYIIICDQGGMAGYEAFPDICRRSDGSLMVVFYDGYGHISHPNTPWPQGGRLSYVVSSDEGRTWSPPQTLYDGPFDDRDPSITCLSGGRLLCSFFSAPAQGSFVMHSDNNGQTWTPPRRIGILFNVSSPCRELKSGRLVMGMYGENEANGQAAGVSVSSDDQGQTWQDLIIMDNAGHYLDAETDMIECKDGILYAIHRGGKGANMHWTTSMDQGLNWGRTCPLDFEGHCPYLHRAENGIIVLGYRGLFPDQWATLIRYSVDECRTWSKPVLVDSVSGAYPSLVNLQDRSILIVYYEEGDTSNIRGRRFRITRLGITWLPFI